jgi:hypothetical protein
VVPLRSNHQEAYLLCKHREEQESFPLIGEASYSSAQVLVSKLPIFNITAQGLLVQETMQHNCYHGPTEIILTHNLRTRKYLKQNLKLKMKKTQERSRKNRAFRLSFSEEGANTNSETGQALVH